MSPFARYRQIYSRPISFHPLIHVTCFFDPTTSLANRPESIPELYVRRQVQLNSGARISLPHVLVHLIHIRHALMDVPVFQIIARAFFPLD